MIRLIIASFFYLLAAISLVIGVLLPAQSGRNASNFAPFYVFTLVMTVFGEIIRRQPATASAPSTHTYPVHPVIHPRHPIDLEPDAPVSFPTPIAAVRDLAGTTPRWFDAPIERYLSIAPPAWLKANPADELSLNFRQQARIRRDGPIVWAAIVQANTLLFSPGPHDCPASVIFSPDPWFDTHPEDLAAIANDLYDLKGTDQADPGAAAFARVLTSELTRAMRLQVPTRYTAGRPVFHSAIMLPRKHLPKGYLAGSLFPVWLDPADTGALLLVPAAFWPPGLLAEWDSLVIEE